MKEQTKVDTRYFFVCTMGTLESGDTVCNTFDIKSTGGFPTIKKCIELSGKSLKNTIKTILVSISEISEKDWEVFVSEQ